MLGRNQVISLLRLTGVGGQPALDEVPGQGRPP